jgi:hypothetical protein
MIIRSLAVVVATLGLAGFAQAQGGPLDPQHLEALWTDLASPDDARSSRALLALAASPETAVPFLAARLEPVRRDPVRIRQLIEQLGDPQRPRRLDAIERLTYLGEYARRDLETALQARPEGDVATSLREILDQLPLVPEPPGGRNRRRGGFAGGNVSVQNINGQVTITVDGKPVQVAGGPDPQASRPDPWRRAVRAIALLERAGTPEARKVLDTLATGEDDAPPTREARIALRGLDANAPGR